MGATSELHRVFQTLHWALQPACLISLLETIQKLTPDDFREGSDREQEAVAGGNPSLAIGAQPAAGCHQVQVRM